MWENSEVGDPGFFLCLAPGRLFLGLSRLDVTFGKIKMSARVMEEKVFAFIIEGPPKDNRARRNIPGHRATKDTQNTIEPG